MRQEPPCNGRGEWSAPRTVLTVAVLLLMVLTDLDSELLELLALFI